MRDVEVRASTIEGLGTFTTRDVAAGESIFEFGGKRVSVPRLAVEILRRRVRWDDPLSVSDKEFMILDHESRCVNHSCSPNAAFRHELDFFALRDIAAGEELFYDYSMVTPRRWYAFRWSMQCSCGLPHCRQTIGDIRTVPDDVLHAHLAHGGILDYIVRRA